MDFNSHNPIQHKKAVAKTLLHRAKEISTDENLRQEEVDKVIGLKPMVRRAGFSNKYRSPTHKLHNATKTPEVLLFYLT